jgi:hypothetical protein
MVSNTKVEVWVQAVSLKPIDIYQWNIRITNFVIFYNFKYGDQDLNRTWLPIQSFVESCKPETSWNLRNALHTLKY